MPLAHSQVVCTQWLAPFSSTPSAKLAVLTLPSRVQADVDVGPVNAAGLRGTLAARDFAPGDTVIAVPFNLTVAIGEHNALASVRALADVPVFPSLAFPCPVASVSLCLLPKHPN